MRAGELNRPRDDRREHGLELERRADGLPDFAKGGELSTERVNSCVRACSSVSNPETLRRGPQNRA